MNLRTNRKNIFVENSFEALAEAIVKQAVVDYKNALRSKNTGVINEIERFMKSEYFGLLVNLEGDIIIKEMRRKFDDNRKAS